MALAMHPRAPTLAGFALCTSLLGGSPVAAEPPGPLDEARSMHMAGQWREALAAYREVAEKGEPADAAVAHNNSCTIFNRLGEYPAALEACGEALALRRGEIRMDDLGPARPILDAVLEAHRALAAGGPPPIESLAALSRSLLAGFETELATCRSALGGIEDGRAFASLTGSFLTAGSSAVVASLWDVGDEASAAFMSQFYYQLGRGHAPASALRRAKLRLRADPAWDRPELWAAFILIGDAPGVTQRRLIPLWAWIAAALVISLWVVRRCGVGSTEGRD